jgi:hypothetical protein
MNVKLASMGNCQRNMPQVWVVAWSGVPAGEVWAAEVLGLSFDGRPVFLLLAKKHLTGEAVCEWIFKNVMFPFIESELAELRAVLDPEKQCAQLPEPFVLTMDNEDAQTKAMEHWLTYLKEKDGRWGLLAKSQTPVEQAADAQDAFKTVKVNHSSERAIDFEKMQS